MFEITFFSTTVFALCFLLVFYIIVFLINRGHIKHDLKKLLLYVTLFSLFGVTGEVFVNTLYMHVFGSPLWEYHLFPAHNGNISYFFLFIWGSLAFYKYISEILFSKSTFYKSLPPAIVIAGEAIFVELLYNGIYYLLFNDYIFYYLPGNLGPFSHFSCLQVTPFYFLFGYGVTQLISNQNRVKLNWMTILFYWFIIVTFVWMG